MILWFELHIIVFLFSRKMHIESQKILFLSNAHTFCDKTTRTFKFLNFTFLWCILCLRNFELINGILSVVRSLMVIILYLFQLILTLLLMRDSNLPSTISVVFWNIPLKIAFSIWQRMYILSIKNNLIYLQLQ